MPGRDDPVQDAARLEDFRSKYRLYRSDPDLQAMHARYPWSTCSTTTTGSDGPGDPQAAAARERSSNTLPVREDQPGRIRRSLRWGDLADVFVTDQRPFRDRDARRARDRSAPRREEPEILDPRRTMLGVEQREPAHPRTGRIQHPMEDPRQPADVLAVANRGRLPCQPHGAGTYLNLTQWDGYVAERPGVLDALESADGRNTLVVSGDSHVFSAAKVAPDVDDPRSTTPGRGIRYRFDHVEQRG